MGDPVEKLVEEVRFSMASGYSVGNFCMDKVSCMLEFG
jgi:hypothetical protein